MEQVVIVGGMNIDYSEISERGPVGHHNIASEACLGGRAVNYAFQLDRLGIKSDIFGAVGRDTNGTRLADAINKLEKCKAHIQQVDRNTPNVKPEETTTGMTFVAPNPTRYFHIPGANQHDFSAVIAGSGNIWKKAHCCIADLETNHANIRAAFQHFRGDPDSLTINILDATYPASRPERDILEMTDVLILRRADASAVIDAEEYRKLAEQLMLDRDSMTCFHEFALCAMSHGPRCVILSLEGQGCMWAIARDPDELMKGLNVGRTPGISSVLPYPNSAHAAFAATVAQCVATSRLDSQSDRVDRSEFLLHVHWGDFCRRATAAYVLAAKSKGASESMPHGKDIHTLYGAVPTATRTIVSLDVKGSTGIQAFSSTQEWRQFREILTDMVGGELYAHSPGFVSWTGDGFWIVFDGARNAVQSAIAIADRLDGQKILSQGKKIPIKYRIGVNTGDVVVGEDGSAQGLPASIAKRAEDKAGVNQVVITGQTLMLLNERDGFKFGKSTLVTPEPGHDGEPEFMIYEVARKKKNLAPKAAVSAVSRIDLTSRAY